MERAHFNLNNLELHKKIKVIAAKTGMDIKDIVEDALNQWLKSYQKKS